MTLFIIAFAFIMVIWVITRGLSPQGRGGRRNYDGTVWPNQSDPNVFPPHTDLHQHHHHNPHTGFGHADGVSHVNNSAGGYTADSNVNAGMSGGGSSDFGGFGGGSDFGGGGSGGDFGGGGNGGGGGGSDS
jgi:hypothetical protein